jgi:hypothetical protein
MIANLQAGFVQVNQAQVARTNISVMAPLSKRQSAWERLACDVSLELLAEMTRVEPMSKVAGVASAPSSIGRRIRVVSSDRSGSRVALAEISTRATVLLQLPQPSRRLPRLEKCEPTMTPSS